MLQPSGEPVEHESHANEPIGLAPSTDSAAHLTLLLNQLQLTESSRGEESEHFRERRLIQSRLGVGSSLFTALQHKHAESAAHCLRVALSCSSWAVALGLEYPVLDEIEIAALLHDVGKIGVPDTLLQKAGTLTDEEKLLVNTHRLMGLEIIRSFGASETICDIVRLAPAWYQLEAPTDLPKGDDIPLGARILAIADAFDSMTNDQVYRPRVSHEEALTVLQTHAGTQFDPNLTRHFCDMHARNQGEVHVQVAERWLQQLTPPPGTYDWHVAPMSGVCATAESLAPLFLEKLIGSMRDGVVFIDEQMHIKLWNRGAECLTGITSEQIAGETFKPSLIRLRDESGLRVPDEECPVRHVLESSVQSIRRLQVTNRDGRSVVIDMHIVPVLGPEGGTHGANLLMHDASSETSLEERVQTLHEKATKDPLTQIANRAEFDRAHKRFVDAHANRARPGSLIICDIDHFKKVNDTYGHPAGDEALKVFAKLLERNCRSGDLVARYGGEEFVMLCADCDADAGAARAEDIRQQLRDLVLPMLGGKTITASFGVTETLQNDTDTEMLHRADAALLNAKENGRDNVVKIGISGDYTERKQDGRWFSRWRDDSGEPILQREMITLAPLRITVQKLRGFITDNRATVSLLGRNQVELRIPASGGFLRRGSDRPMGMVVDLTFAEERVLETSPDRKHRVGQLRTRVFASVQPLRSRDRRRSDLVERAESMLANIKSYLMASDFVAKDGEDRAISNSSPLDPAWLGLPPRSSSR